VVLTIIIIILVGYTTVARNDIQPPIS